VTITEVNKHFGKGVKRVDVLRDINLEIRAGEVLVLLGPSGCGKSTLLRLIAGLDSPSEGKVAVDGQQVSGVDSRCGFVFQEPRLLPWLSLKDNVAIGARGKRSEKEILELLASVGLAGFEKHIPRQVSGGMAQRTALARGLAGHPGVLLLDEPFAALDAELRARIREEIKQVLDKVSSTTILVTHDQEEALSIADRVALLRDGNFAQVGNPREIYSAPVDLGVATFLGDSVIVDGVIESGKVSTSLGQLTLLNSAKEASRGKVAIRPENFYLQPDLNGDSIVVGRQFFGHDAVVEVKTPKQLIRARSSGPFAPEVGMKVTVWVRGAVNFYPEA
jgi:iron(III) transport system ATP-binding protein